MTYKCDECGSTSEEKKSCCDTDMNETEEENKKEPELEGDLEDELKEENL